MTTDQNDLRELIAMAKAMGVRRIKINDVEIVFWREDAPKKPGAVELAPLGEADGMPSEDQLLYMSGIPLDDSQIKAGALDVPG